MNKIRLFKLTFLVLTGCLACNNPANNQKSDILPLDTVATLVADCFFLEGEISIRQWAHDIKDYSAVKYDSFFEEHKITKEIFVKNVRYYFLDDKYADNIMNKIDELVEQRVATLRDSLNLEQ